MNLLDYSNFYLVGVKGVAMTSLAQCLLDAGKKVSGSDVAEDFITQEVLAKLNLKIDTGFDQPIDNDVNCLIYTGAHQGKQNSQVQAALQKQLPVFSQAEAIASLFNQKKGIAVCGVGGKSTVSAMITWILEKSNISTSFSVGVGNIIGLNKTGQWQEKGEYFVAEADEYVINPEEVKEGKSPIPRFSFLTPLVTVCTNLKFDHPDVYQNFDQTKQAFANFFAQIKSNGYLIVNINQQSEIEKLLEGKLANLHLTSFGTQPFSDWQLLSCDVRDGATINHFKFQNTNYQFLLKIPGEYNSLNALAAMAACYQLGVSVDQAIRAISSFQSTKRRFEFIKKHNQVSYYDDYAHHPDEISVVVKALTAMFPDKRLMVAFQPHTFSRTKALLSQFVEALSQIDNLILLDIFASARESFDTSISSKILAREIERKTNNPIINLTDYHQLADYLVKNTQPEDVVLTIGAGDIYKAHELIK